MKQRIATIARTKEILERYGLYTKKGYGQNFIIEPAIVEKIATAAVEDEDCFVIEVGPGIGALTECLCQRSNHVVAFEIDKRMPPVLKAEIDSSGLEIILQDFLEVDIDQVIQTYRKNEQKVVFVSNLPYYITTPILFKLFEAKESIESITVMMQKEVGQRFLAGENEKEYNALSVIWQYKCDVKKVTDVSRHVFWPSPRVDSVVLQFRFHHRYQVKDEALFFALVKACFTQRRKTLYNNLQTFLKDKALAAKCLEQAGIELNRRAQQCTVEDFIHLYEVNYEDICACKGESVLGCS